MCSGIHSSPKGAGAFKQTSLGRRLVLIDIENYCGKPVLETEDVIGARASIELPSKAGSGDLFVIGTSHTHNFLSAKRAWPGAEHVFGRGHNGADVAIIEAARRHLTSIRTFEEVLMLSGDGIFTTLMREIGERGVSTTVVSLAGQLNRNLAKAASRVRIIDREPSPTFAFAS